MAITHTTKKPHAGHNTVLPLWQLRRKVWNSTQPLRTHLLWNAQRRADFLRTMFLGIVATLLGLAPAGTALLAALLRAAGE